MIVVDLRHVGTTAWLSEVLKISVRTSVSCAIINVVQIHAHVATILKPYDSFVCETD